MSFWQSLQYLSLGGGVGGYTDLAIIVNVYAHVLCHRVLPENTVLFAWTIAISLSKT